VDSAKVKTFMELAGQSLPSKFSAPSESIRKLGSQLLLTELLEYIIKGLNVTPVINGVRITKSEEVSFEANGEVDLEESLDGLADVAYTMFWNALALGAPLEEAFELVCENNLEKFVKLDSSHFKAGLLPAAQWDCERGVVWPSEVETVTAVQVSAGLFAVGKDGRGKVRKPSTYTPVDLAPLLPRTS
jgi:hypothetical protein